MKKLLCISALLVIALGGSCFAERFPRSMKRLPRWAGPDLLFQPMALMVYISPLMSFAVKSKPAKTWGSGGHIGRC
jgi:hypothetical protein